MPFSGLSFTAESGTTKLAYGSFGIMPFGIAVNMSSGLKPLIASSTSAASLTVLQWMPARSPAFLLGDPAVLENALGGQEIARRRSWTPALCRTRRSARRSPQVARLADTETPEPLLVPRGTRAVSYGLQAWPLHGAY